MSQNSIPKRLSLKVRGATLFTADALHSHADLLSLAGLGGTLSQGDLPEFPSRNHSLTGDIKLRHVLVNCHFGCILWSTWTIFFSISYQI